MTSSKHFKIPEDATLKVIIEILNQMGLIVNPHKDNKAWIYEHKDWYIDNGVWQSTMTNEECIHESKGCSPCEVLGHCCMCRGRLHYEEK